jgi:hypothetical protein
MLAMNLSADYIYHRVGYEDIKRIYNYFINNDDIPYKNKRYLYDNELNSNLERRTKDQIWRSYMKKQRTKAIHNIVDLMKEMDSSDNIMRLNQGVAYNELSIE